MDQKGTSANRPSLTSDHHQRVRAMTLGFGQKVRSKPGIPTESERERIVRLVFEEAFELAEAMGIWVCHDGSPISDSEVTCVCSTAKMDLVESADAFADLSVVVNSGMAACGIDAGPLLLEVDENNLLKIKNGYLDPESGKFIKPENHPKPDIAGVLSRQSL